MEKLTTYDPKKHKRILAGCIEDGIFIKQVTSKHFFRKLQAYAIQEDIIQKLVEKDIQKIKIINSTSIYESNITDWINGNTLLRDYGNGLQRFLPIHYMQITRR